MASILTVGGFKTEIRAIFGGRVDFDSRLNAVLALTQDRIARLHDFDELRQRAAINTVVTGDPAADKIISLTSLGRYRKIYDIRLFATTARDRKLKKITPRRWDQLIAKSEYYSRGVPTHYLKWGTTDIELWRVPNAVYPLNFRYSVWPATIGGDGTTLTLSNVDDLIIHLAGSYLALTSGHIERSRELYVLFQRLAEEAFKEDIEDFDTHIAAHGSEIGSEISRGYDDPFVRQMP